jgi:hypothetical protein
MPIGLGSSITVNSSKQVVVQLRGGLGNQLFGFFAGLHLAESNKCQLVLDARFIKFGSNPTRRLEISGLDMSYIKTPIKTLGTFPLPSSRLGQKFIRRFKDSIASYLKKNLPVQVMTDSSTITDFHLNTDVLLDGYFSTFTHFKQWHENNPDFKLQPISPSHDYLKLESSVRNLTGLHIRLGDYLKHADLYPIPSEDYYEKALEHIGGNSGYIVFCEHLEEAKKNFPSTIAGADLIITSKMFNSVETLCLMANCENLVTANSTFSQWAGAFVALRNGKVIYPSRFLVNSENQIAEKNWIRLDINTGSVV